MNLSLNVSLLTIALITSSPILATAQNTALNSHAGHAHSNHDHDSMNIETGPHGGLLQLIGEHRVETVLVEKGIMFMLLEKKGNAVAAPDACGTVKLRVGDDAKEYAYQLHRLKNQAIGVGVDLSKVKKYDLHMEVQLTNVDAEPLSFQVTGRLADDQLSDAVLISLQATCPVNGKLLGSMGAPPKIMVGGKALFVCCAGCSSKVRSSPDQYFTKVYSAKGEQVRPGVFTATLADAAAIGAQKICLVLDEPLGGIGVPMKVDVNGKAVYICCAACSKKLAAFPDEYLAKLTQMGVTPPASH
ncbi:hypothetical protein [Aureliella helgolandensis]|uniref:Metal-binding domain of cation transport ATPase n=1 Tax=Aureliella helgolandensis TaxID=2527968 RepID=A0A518GBT1_9BACT|nr:hypothetical protein [Aureliella helgolandensis]QDV26023.1 hypothetical protein Q31a_43930 [Aureliella helgolandensis]